MLSVFISKHYWMKLFLIYQIVCLWLEGSKKGIHRGRIFLEGVEKHAGKWLCGVKLLSNSIYPCMNVLEIWIKVQSDWQRNQDRAIQMKTVWSWHLWESEHVCVQVCAHVYVCVCVCVEEGFACSVAVAWDYIHPCCYHCRAAHIPSAKISLNCRDLYYF